MMIMGDGFCNQTKKPPIELPLEFGGECYSYENGFWVAVSPDFRKRLGELDSGFVRDIARVYCQYTRPVQAYRFPYN
jgi:hypothetical protein